MLTRFSALLACLLVAGCATVPPPSLSPDTVASFKLVDVRVEFPPGAQINYTTAEDEFARTKNVSPADGPAIDAAIKTPEGTAYVHQRASERLKAAILRDVGPLLAGTRPVRAEVQVTRIDIPGGARKVAMAVLAGSHQSMLTAQITLVDAKSGAALLSRPEQREIITGSGAGLLGLAAISTLEASGAVDPPFDRLAKLLAIHYASWLRP